MRRVSKIRERAVYPVVGLWALAWGLSACGAQPPLDAQSAQAIRDRAAQAGRELNRASHSELRPETVDVEAEDLSPVDAQTVPEDFLPEAPAGHLVGDGYGPSLREAVLEARRTISEQIAARMSSEVDVRSAEENGVEDHTTQVRVRTVSDFDHVQLIRVLGSKRLGDQRFIARAVLPLEALRAVYQEEIRKEYEALSALQPRLRAAIAQGDTALLLNAQLSPSVLMARQHKRAAVLRAMGSAVPPLAPEGSAELARLASEARAKVQLRLHVAPAQIEGAEGLNQAVAGLITEQLAQQGCALQPADLPLTADQPAVDFHLEVSLRDHLEGGLHWRYVGLSLRAMDADTQRPVFQFSALPELAHGGGRNEAQADRAVVRRLGEKLEEKSAAFAALNCR